MSDHREKYSKGFSIFMLIAFVLLLMNLVIVAIASNIMMDNAQPTSGIVVSKQVQPGYEYTERECTFLRLDCKDVVKYQESFYQFEIWDHERNKYGYVEVPILDFDKYRVGDTYPKE